MIAVVGGGITGLATGLELERMGLEYVVLEATDRPGGVIRSAEIDGRILDWGPQRTRLTKGIAALIEALGLESRVVTAPRDLDLYVYRGGRLRKVPFSIPDLLRSDIASFGGKARLLLEPFGAAADPDESVADFFRRKVGTELYEVLVGPLYGGLYGSDPADMVVGLSLGHVLRELGVGRSLLAPLVGRGGRIEPPPACSFDAGMQELPRAIAGALGRNLVLDAPVRTIRRAGAGWRLESAGRSFDAEAVVICTPARAAGELLAPVAADAAAAVRSLRYNPLAIVHLDAETELRGSGFQVAFTERDLKLRGVTFNDSMFDRRDLYTAYLGGAFHPEVVDMDREELALTAAREFTICTGYDATALAVELEWMPAWDVSWAATRDLRLPEGLHVAGNWRSRPGLPGRLAEAGSVARAAARQERPLRVGVTSPA